MPACISCLNWDLRGGDRNMAGHGFAVCKVHSRSKAVTYAATYKHECKQFTQALTEVVEARRRFIDKLPKESV